MSQPDPGAVPERPHHISSIAHLFLQDEDAGTSPAASVKPLEVVVASPGETPASALAAAGLTVGAPGAASLVEDAQVRWSAGTYFRGEPDLPNLVENESPYPANRWEHGPQAKRSLSCYHLGSLHSGKLSQLEALASSRSLGRLALDGVDVLAWCLLHRELGRFSPAYVLGRLAEILKPRALRILVFPDAWARAGLPGWLDEIHTEDTTRWSPVDFFRASELAGRVCGPVPVEVQAVGGLDNLARVLTPTGLAQSLWKRLPREMMELGGAS